MFLGDGEPFRGYVDIGAETNDDDSKALVKDALVFMAVGVNGSWKIPIAYFFIYGLNGKERATLTIVCMNKLHDVGAIVIISHY